MSFWHPHEVCHVWVSLRLIETNLRRPSWRTPCSCRKSRPRSGIPRPRPNTPNRPCESAHWAWIGPAPQDCRSLLLWVTSWNVTKEKGEKDVKTSALCALYKDVCDKFKVGCRGQTALVVCCAVAGRSENPVDESSQMWGNIWTEDGLTFELLVTGAFFSGNGLKSHMDKGFDVHKIVIA